MSPNRDQHTSLQRGVSLAKKRKPTIAIVGAGRVGRALGRALRAKGWRIGYVITTHKKTAQAAVRAIGGGSPQNSLTAESTFADVVLIATPDSFIELTSRFLAGVARAGDTERRRSPRGSARYPLRGRVVLHASGAQDSSVLQPLAELGADVGSMHPLQTFSAGKHPDFRGLLFTMEGTARARKIAGQIARELGATAVTIPASAKPAYHCAGAFAAAHVLSVAEAATQMLVRLGFPRAVAQRGLLRMARETLDNLEALGPRATWTGPVSRGDYSTVAKHFAALDQFPEEFGEAHAALLRLSARVIARNPAAVLKRLQAMEKQKE